MGLITTTLISLAVVLIVKWFWDRHQKHQTWKRLGVKGPAASSIVFGNLLDIVNTGRFKLMKQWTKQYGKVFGYYDCATPCLSVSDPDMIREILIKQYHNFSDRRVFVDLRHIPENSLIEQDGSQWKKVRGLSSPTFSAKRMKQMSPLVHKSIDKLMDRFQMRVNEGKAFDIYTDMQRLTLDVIATVVFSYDSESFTNENNIFLKKLIKMFDGMDMNRQSFWLRVRLTIALLFPGLLKVIQMFYPNFIKPENDWFLELGEKMIKDRMETGEFRADYIQMMLMANNKSVSSGNLSGGETDDDGTDNESTRELRKAAKKKELSMAEMKGSIYVFLAAGYETTATTLGFMSYYLALYPDVQEKLRQEVDNYFPNPRDITYDDVQKLQYMDMVFQETSRLGSIGHLVQTRMTEKTTDVCGMKIEAGTKIMINVPAVHASEDLWGPEPMEEFVPERFLPERKGNRHPMAYLPFGSGPRNCIGMRFAIMEAKMAMTNLLMRYRIVRCEETRVPLPINKDGIHGPSEGVYVKLELRE